MYTQCKTHFQYVKMGCEGGLHCKHDEHDAYTTEKYGYTYLSRVAIGASDQVRYKPGYTTTEDGKKP